MKRFFVKGITATILVVVLAFPPVTSVFADQNPNGTGRPGAPINTCGPDNPVTPGNTANSPGSPFNPSGTAGGVYNPLSQYDIACYQLSQPQP